MLFDFRSSRTSFYMGVTSRGEKVKDIRERARARARLSDTGKKNNEKIIKYNIIPSHP